MVNLKYILCISLVLLNCISFSQTTLNEYSKLKEYSSGLKITIEDRHENMQFGWSVAITGKYVFVGSPNYSTKKYKDLGILHIFKIEKDSFSLNYKLPPHSLRSNIFYGKCIKYSNNLLAISSSRNTYSSPKTTNDVFGTVVVRSFLNKRKNTIQKILTFKKSKKNVLYGDQIALSSSYIAVNAPFFKNKNKSTGLVSVYKITSNDVKLLVEITPPPSTHLFGSSLAISDNNLIISAKNEVFIYQIKDSLAIVSSHIKKPTADNFGGAVTITNNYAFVSSPSSIPPYYGYDIPKGDSLQTILIRGEDGKMKKKFISSDSLSDVSNEILLGNVTLIFDSITAYKTMEEKETEKVFVYKKFLNNKWKYHQTIVSNKRIPFEFFGNSINAKDSLCVVGAFSSPISYEFNNNNAYAGAAYVFQLNKKGYWRLTGKLLPNNRAYWTKFGFSVATDGKSIVVGSRFDKTDKEDKNLIKEAGAVYYYRIKER